MRGPAEERRLRGEGVADRARAHDQHGRYRHPEVQEQVRVLGRDPLGGRGTAAEARPGRVNGDLVTLGRAERAVDVVEVGTGEDEGGAVDSGDEGGGHSALQRAAERGGVPGWKRVCEQGGATAAGQAGGEGVGLRDVRLPHDRGRARRRREGERHGGAIQCTAQHLAGDVRVRGGGEQLTGLDGAEAVPVEHPHHPERRRPALDPTAQSSPELARR